jgi:hypothetical protein
MNKILAIAFFLTISGKVYSQTRFNPYVPQVPLNQMAQIGIYKQQLYDSRKNQIQENVNTIVDNINELPSSSLISTYRKRLSSYLSSISYADFSDNNVYNIIFNNLRSINNDILEELNP